MIFLALKYDAATTMPGNNRLLQRIVVTDPLFSHPRNLLHPYHRPPRALMTMIYPSRNTSVVCRDSRFAASVKLSLSADPRYQPQDQRGGIRLKCYPLAAFSETSTMARDLRGIPCFSK